MEAEFLLEKISPTPTPQNTVYFGSSGEQHFKLSRLYYISYSPETRIWHLQMKLSETDHVIPED